jgi:hypothetical protein
MVGRDANLSLIVSLGFEVLSSKPEEGALSSGASPGLPAGLAEAAAPGPAVARRAVWLAALRWAAEGAAWFSAFAACHRAWLWLWRR